VRVSAGVAASALALLEGEADLGAGGGAVVLSVQVVAVSAAVASLALASLELVANARRAGTRRAAGGAAVAEAAAVATVALASLERVAGPVLRLEEKFPKAPRSELSASWLNLQLEPLSHSPFW